MFDGSVVVVELTVVVVLGAAVVAASVVVAGVFGGAVEVKPSWQASPSR